MQEPQDQEELRLARALRQDAKRSMPAFSPELHRRVLEHLGSKRRSRWRTRQSLGWAAAVLIAAAGVWSFRVNREPLNRNCDIAIPSVAKLPEQFMTAADAALWKKVNAEPFAYLDQDADRFGDFVLKHLMISTTIPATLEKRTAVSLMPPVGVPSPQRGRRTHS